MNLYVSLLFFSILISKTISVCNYIYLDEIPYPLETCIWNSPTYSFGIYCSDTLPNGTSLNEEMVIELYFPSPDCPNGFSNDDAKIYDIYPCDDDCVCSGITQDCTISTKRTYDWNFIFVDYDTGNPGCNESWYVDEKFAWKSDNDNICLGRGILGSYEFICNDTYSKGGVTRKWYDQTDCTDLIAEAQPDITACEFWSCDGDLILPEWKLDDEKNKGNNNTIIYIIIAIILVLCCCGFIIAYFICIKRKQKKEVYFENDQGQTGGTSGYAKPDTSTRY